MRLLTMTASAFLALGACVSPETPSGAGSEGVATLEPEAEAEAQEQEDQRLRLPATVDEGDGFKVRVTVVVNDDREGAEIDFEGDTYDLAWDRRENKACNCRSYENESFVAVVTFPTENSDGKVDIKAKAP